MATANALSNEPVVWSDCPATDNFNPGTAHGQKLYDKLSKGHPDGKLFTDSVKDSSDVLTFLRTRAISLGPAVTHVPVEWNPDGTIRTYKNVIDQYHSIDLRHMQVAAMKRYGVELNNPVQDLIPPTPWAVRDINPSTSDDDKKIFYDRVRGNLVNQLVDNILDPKTLESLELMNAREYTFYDTQGNAKKDGPTKLYLFLKRCDPSTNVNIENHRRFNEQARMHMFNNDVVKLIDTMELHHKTIVDNEVEYTDASYLRHMITALESGPNAEFNEQIKAIKRDIESGFGHHSNITPSQLARAATTFYNNIVSVNEWNKVDPRDAQILALTTKLNDVQSKLVLTTQTQSNASATRTGTGGGNTSTQPPLPEWRTQFKGEKIVIEDETWNWCPHHVAPGKFNGLYYKDHDKSTHPEWKEKRMALNESRRTKRQNKAAAATTKATEPKALTISNKLRSALATNLCVSEEDIRKVEELAQEN